MTKAMTDYAFRTRVDLPFEATVKGKEAMLGDLEVDVGNGNGETSVRYRRGC